MLATVVGALYDILFGMQWAVYWEDESCRIYVFIGSLRASIGMIRRRVFGTDECSQYLHSLRLGDNPTTGSLCCPTTVQS
jgi:hypothetical protein